MTVDRKDDLRNWFSDVGWLYLVVGLIVALTVILSVGWGTVKVFLMNATEVVEPVAEKVQ